MAKTAREVVAEIDASIVARAATGFARRTRIGDKEVELDPIGDVYRMREYLARQADAESGTAVGNARVVLGRGR